MVSMVASCSMLRAPGNPLPGAGHGLAAASNEGRISAGAVVSAQAVVTTQATMAVAMRSLRRIIEASVQLRFVTGDAFALDRADTAIHDRPSPSAEHQIKLTELAYGTNVGPRSSRHAVPA